MIKVLDPNNVVIETASELSKELLDRLWAHADAHDAVVCISYDKTGTCCLYEQDLIIS